MEETEKPDYQHWLKSPTWTLIQAACLLCGHDPIDYHYNAYDYDKDFFIQDNISKGKYPEKVSKMYLLVHSAYDAEEIKKHTNTRSTNEVASPVDFIAWAKSKYLQFPAELEPPVEKVIIFYELVDGWMIGLKSNEEQFNHLKGFTLLHYLLKECPNPVGPFDLYYLGNIPDEINGIEFSTYQKLEQLSPKEFSELLEQLKEKLETATENGPQRIEIMEEISLLKKYQNEGKHGFKNADTEQARINCRRLLKSATDKIIAGKPELKDFFSFGKNCNIDTSGGKFTYRNLKLAKLILEKP